MRKKLTQLILAAIMIPLGLSAQIWPDNMFIEGLVLQNGTPVANHTVCVGYSSNVPSGISGTECTVTNASGWYWFNINDGSVIGPNVVFEVYTEDSCNNLLSETFDNGQGTIDSDTVNFNLCEITQPFCSASITAQQDPMDSTLYTFTASNLTGVAPFMYEWWPNGGTTQSITTQITPNIDLVCLTVTDANGCIAYVCDTVYPSGCFASFYFGNGPSSVIAGDPIPFYFTGSSEIGNVYEWTVDGLPNYIDNPGIANPIMAFPSAGFYEVCVSIDNGNGCSDTYCETITVEPSSSNCSAMINMSEDTVGGVLNVELNAIANGVAPFTYQWLNGATTQTIYLQNVVGVDSMCVTITDANGCTATSCELVGFNPGNCEGWISGFVGVTAISGPIPLDEGTVWLITYDPLTNLLTAVDSVEVDTSGYFFFGPIPCGDYLIKAAAGPNSDYYNDHIPTYFGNSPFWDFAQTISLSQTNIQVITQIELIAGANPGGPGFIGGDVTQGANKMGDIGDPVAGVTVMLFDNSSNAIGYTYTDVNGEFGFDDLAWGTYQVYVEMLNKTTTPVVVTIGPNQPSFESVHVLVFDTEITTSIDEPEIVLNTTGLYPNPTIGNVSIELASEAPLDLQIIVRDLTGRVVMSKPTTLSVGGNKINLDVTRLSEGYYNVEFFNAEAAVKLNEKLIVVD